MLDRPAVLSGQRAATWEADGHRYVYLDRAAGVRVGAMGFEGSRALVRITRTATSGSSLVDLAVVIDDAASVVEHAGDAPADTAVGAAAERLLVTATTRAGVSLEVDALERIDGDPDAAFVRAALGRLERYDASVTRVVVPDEPPAPLLTEAQKQRRDAVAAEVAERRKRLIDQARSQPGPPGELVEDAAAQTPPPDPGVLPARGVVSYQAGGVVIDLADAQDGDESVVSLVDGVTVIFEDYTRGRTVSLRARRAVLFLREKDDADADNELAVGDNALDAGDLVGVYLEDNAIITDGDYTVRAPRVYYDLQNNRAILLDAVMFTYDLKRNVPLYLRAEVMRQTAARSFTAEGARFTTSEFHEPHVALGAGKVTVSQYETEDGVVGQSVDASGITLRVGETPVFYWPRFAARGTDTPLRRVKAGYSSNDGVTVETEWDLFGLLGREEPEGVEANALIDVLGEHGVGLGVEADYELDDMYGNIDAYSLLSDNGDDDLPRRGSIDQDGETRGFALVQHRQSLPNGLDVSVEGAYVSDETFLEEFFLGYAEEHKPFETSLYLDRRDEETQVTALLKTNVNDFLPQTDALQSPGYTVDRFPELAYRRLGTPVFDDALTWYSENTGSVMRARFGEDTPADRGFNNAQSLATFGIPNTTSFEDAADAAGFPDDTVLRLDTRQELLLPLEAGPVNITPFAVGRVTGYDEDFEDFNGNDDQARLWGQLGTRVSTELHHTYADTQSRVLDLDGIRHVVEPNATISWAESSMDLNELPVFDADVESITQGGTFKLGLNQTFQTRRGGPGRQRTVDWVRVNSYVAFQTEDELDTEAFGRFYDYRPEFARGGDHFYTELLWQLSDAVGVAGEVTYDFEDDTVAQWRLGGTLQHTPRFTSFLTYEELDPVDSAVLTYGLNYQLTTKYRVAASQSFDFSGNSRRVLNLALERKLPRWRFLVTASWDQLEDEQTVGFVLIPDGFGGGRGIGTGLFN